jgi:hypothetical protein
VVVTVEQLEFDNDLDKIVYEIVPYLIEPMLGILSELIGYDIDVFVVFQNDLVVSVD